MQLYFPISNCFFHIFFFFGFPFVDAILLERDDLKLSLVSWMEANQLAWTIKLCRNNFPSDTDQEKSRNNEKLFSVECEFTMFVRNERIKQNRNAKCLILHTKFRTADSYEMQKMECLNFKLQRFWRFFFHSRWGM